MSRARGNRRADLVRAAAKLSLRQGFRTTNLAKIAAEASVPLGNVYYYFKTKNEIGAAVIEQRLAEFKELHSRWDDTGSPKARLMAFLSYIRERRYELARDGCKMGTLATELRKADSQLAKSARPLLGGPFDWIEAQFRYLGRGTESRALALHLLSAVQGVSVLANSFRDPTLVITEIERLRAWIRAL